MCWLHHHHISCVIIVQWAPDTFAKDNNAKKKPRDEKNEVSIKNNNMNIIFSVRRNEDSFLDQFVWSFHYWCHTVNGTGCPIRAGRHFYWTIIFGPMRIRQDETERDTVLQKADGTAVPSSTSPVVPRSSLVFRNQNNIDSDDDPYLLASERLEENKIPRPAQWWREVQTSKELLQILLISERFSNQ